MSKKREKTKKIVKRRLKIKGVLFLLFLIVFLYFGIIFVLKMEVTNIHITGNKYIKSSDLIKNIPNDLKFFGFTSSSLCDKISEDNLIKSCKIKRQIDLSIEIIIEENIPLFYYIPENKIVLSNTSKIDSVSNTYGIPTLINFVPELILNEFIDGLNEVKSDIIRSISEIEYSPSASKDGKFIDEERFVLLMNDGNTIYINNKRLNVLNSYEKIYASIGDKKGTFNFDCDYGNYPFTEYEE